jgi:MoxR-like ATPase
MFLIHVDYPSHAEELAIAKATTGSRADPLETVLDAGGVLRFQSLVRRMPVPDHLYEQAVTLVRRTRPDEEGTPDWLKRVVTWGAGPRAVQYLILGAKARAALNGSFLVREEDLEAVAAPVLNHRILTNFTAQSEGLSTRAIIKRLYEEVSEAIHC